MSSMAVALPISEVRGQLQKNVTLDLESGTAGLFDLARERP